MTEKTILGLAVIFLFVAPLYQFGYIYLSDISIFGFTLAALLMSVSTLMDNPTKKDEEQHPIRKFFKLATYISSLFLIVLPLMVKDTFRSLNKIANSIEPNVFLLLTIGIAFLTLFLSGFYQKQIFKKIDNEKNKAVADALNKYNSQLEELEKKLIENDKK